MKMWHGFLWRNIKVEPSYIIEDCAYAGCISTIFNLLFLLLALLKILCQVRILQCFQAASCFCVVR